MFHATNSLPRSRTPSTKIRNSSSEYLPAVQPARIRSMSARASCSSDSKCFMRPTLCREAAHQAQKSEILPQSTCRLFNLREFVPCPPAPVVPVTANVSCDQLFAAKPHTKHKNQKFFLRVLAGCSTCENSFHVRPRQLFQ